MSRTAERGSVSIEVAVLAPAFIALMVLAGVVGRTAVAAEAIDAAAHDAARAASISRDSGTARPEALDAARQQLGLARPGLRQRPRAHVHAARWPATPTSFDAAFSSPAGAGRHGDGHGSPAWCPSGTSPSTSCPGMPGGKQIVGEVHLAAGPLPEPAMDRGGRPRRHEHGRVSIFLAVAMVGVLAIIGLGLRRRRAAPHAAAGRQPGRRGGPRRRSGHRPGHRHRGRTEADRRAAGPRGGRRLPGRRWRRRPHRQLPRGRRGDPDPGTVTITYRRSMLGLFGLDEDRHRHRRGDRAAITAAP